MKYTILITCLFLPLSVMATDNEVIVLPNYSLKYSVKTTASRETVWKIWRDVENWKAFDTILEYSYLEEGSNFEQGSIGYLKAKGGPKTRFLLLKVEEGISFTERLYIPLYQSIDLQRYFEESADGHVIFTHEVNFKGRLRAMIYTLLAGTFKKELKLVMGRLKALAEDEDKAQELSNMCIKNRYIPSH